MKKISLQFILLILFSACSFSKASKEVVTTKPNDELEFSVDTIEQQDSPINVEEQKIAEAKLPDEISPIEHIEETITAPVEPKFKDFKKVVKAKKYQEIIPNIQVEETAVVASSGAEEKYRVQKGDTLMRVAFKIYGDYRKWKDLKVWNKGKLIEPGAEIKYYVPEHSFGWQPTGLPYLVKGGDTLGIISKDKYGTWRKWRNIFENNRPLIRNPNLIFAGFTIYYVPTRDIASERK